MVAIGHHRLHMEHSSALIVFRWRELAARGFFNELGKPYAAGHDPVTEILAKLRPEV